MTDFGWENAAHETVVAAMHHKISEQNAANENVITAMKAQVQNLQVQRRECFQYSVEDADVCW
jgi:hypothetical protein